MSLKKIPVIVRNRKYKKYTFEENQIRFSYYLALVLKDYYETGIIKHSDMNYRHLFETRRRLKIPGRTFDLIDLELKPQFKLIPEWCFKNKTKKQEAAKWKRHLESFDVLLNV